MITCGDTKHLSKGEKTRQMLVEKAACLFNLKGIAGTSVDNILKASGLNRSSLYNQFENKEELVFACVDYLLEKLDERLKLAIESQNNAVGKIFAFLDLNRHPLNSLIPGGDPIQSLSAGNDEFTPVIRTKIKALLTSLNSTLVEILNQGIRNGELTDELEVENFILKMCCAIQGAIAYCNTVETDLPMQQVIESLRQELLTYSVVES